MIHETNFPSPKPCLEPPSRPSWRGAIHPYTKTFARSMNTCPSFVGGYGTGRPAAKVGQHFRLVYETLSRGASGHLSRSVSRNEIMPHVGFPSVPRIDSHVSCTCTSSRARVSARTPRVGLAKLVKGIWRKVPDGVTAACPAEFRNHCVIWFV